MCGIFGVVANKRVCKKDLLSLARAAEQRGRDSSGLYFFDGDGYVISRATFQIPKLLRLANYKNATFLMGHSRLITNGMADNQPIRRGDVCVIHNGIVVNDSDVWEQIEERPSQNVDTEVIAAIAAKVVSEDGGRADRIASEVLSICKGQVACTVALPRLGKLCLFSNNGSLYLGEKDDACYFASERHPLTVIGCTGIEQVRETGVVLDIPVSESEVSEANHENRNLNLVPQLGSKIEEERLLKYETHTLKRCSRCVLPETMPFIRFNSDGVCNYCESYKPRNKPKPTEELFTLIEKYRRSNGDDCIIPFSGGRDSCYGLHLVVKELKMRPITYTYDWGMVTDLGRRNISRMSAKLGVENIIIADDIAKKRRNIQKNLQAWLKAPDLGMVSILTAGDKHFFRHVETVKKQTGISLNLWGVNPLEITHFKAGFLGVAPDFEEELVYTSSAMKQYQYQSLRFKAMTKSPSYFNKSLFDTLSGEYYRSFHKKTDYFHIFDYWRWDEELIDSVLLDEYDWEKAPDTNTTWRIGDGTAAFYNYIYYTIAGFTEHDTFRSNQIREGDISRERALELVEDENRPRYPNIKWYLDAIDMDFKTVIEVINNAPRLY